MAIYSGFTHLQLVIFHSYVSLPEGNIYVRYVMLVINSTY